MIDAKGCKICGNTLSTSKNDLLIIEGVPDSAFLCSEKTVDLHVADCKLCGAVQLFDVPISSDYDVVHRSIGVSNLYREEKKRQIEKFIKLYDLYNANMVEVGCGNGQFLEIFREIGVKKIIGTEVGAVNYDECLKKGFDVIQGEISDSFDAFVSFHYLEHLPDPMRFVSCLYQILKPGGVGLIEVPNYDYIEKHNIWLEFTKDHRFYYRKRTMCYLLSKCGFGVESIEENDGGICLTVVVKKPESADASFFSIKNQIKKDIGEFKNLVDGFGGVFSVYGGGHYSQLLINMVCKQYGIKPVHIFDSNRQKCGQKICGVVIEYGDNVVNMKDCDNVIIICGIYNGEVYDMLSGLGKNLIKWG